MGKLISIRVLLLLASLAFLNSAIAETFDCNRFNGELNDDEIAMKEVLSFSEQ